MLGEITPIFLEEKLPNVRLTFHMGQHSSALAVRCGCDATDSLTARKFIGKQKKNMHGLCHFSMLKGKWQVKAGGPAESMIWLNIGTKNTLIGLGKYHIGLRYLFLGASKTAGDDQVLKKNSL